MRTISLLPEEISKDDMVIAFMGPIGTGKSTFIDLLTCREGKRAGKTLESVTHHVEATRVLHPQSRERIVLVDTPGFDDTYMTELQVLELIANWLQATYKLNIKLFGIVYLHPISDRRIKGSTLKNLSMFKRLCGELAMASVVFTTTMWKDVDPEDAEEREAQLKAKFWGPMIEIGATVDRLKAASYAEAWRVVDGLIEKRSESNREAIWLQVELVDLKRKLNETDAGKGLYASLQDLLGRIEKQKMSVRAARKQEDDPMIMRELEAELKDIEARIAQVKADAARLKVSFGSRIQKFLNLSDFRFNGLSRSSTSTSNRTCSAELPREIIDAVEYYHRDDILIAIVATNNSGVHGLVEALSGCKDLGDLTGVQAIRVKNHQKLNSRVVLLVAPFTDGSVKGDSRSLEKIYNWLGKRYSGVSQVKPELTALLYLRPLSGDGLGGSPLVNAELYQKLCGNTQPMARVRLVLTDDGATAADNPERDTLMTKFRDFWDGFISLESEISVISGGASSCEVWEIVESLVECADARRDRYEDNLRELQELFEECRSDGRKKRGKKTRTFSYLPFR